jgi:ketosteroid isomerase-like protein
MSQENVVVTPVEYGGPPRRSRTFDERLVARFPSLYRRFSALVLGLSPRSRLRRAVLRRAYVSGLAAFKRGDFKLMLVRYSPEVEFEFNPGLQTLGLTGTFRGHAGRVDALGKLAEAFDSLEIEPAYVLDLGDRVLGLGFFRARARESGVPLEQKLVQLITPGDNGLVAREKTFFSWEEGMRAAGLDPNAIALPSREKMGQAASSAE